jgi:RNA-directed DNA polymerase
VFLHAAGEEREPKPILLYERNMVSPYRSPEGVENRKADDGGGGKGGGRKRMPDGNCPDRDCDIVPRESGQTSLWSPITRKPEQPTKGARQMTAHKAGAATHDPKENTVSTETAPQRKHSPEESVRRLQARIVKAQEAGKYNKVKVLQRMLAHSQSARILAVERVSTNNGSKTPGVDGET